MQRIVVIGAGFAGLWAAVGAARKLETERIGRDCVEIVVVNRTHWHSIRVRNYEADLSDTLVPLADVLDPIGVRHIEGEVTGIDLAGRTVVYSSGGCDQDLRYDRLVFALGSRATRPPIPGLKEFAFDVDTYEAAVHLNAHIAALPSRSVSAGQSTALVIGAGLTGLEAATEMVGKLRAALAGRDPAHNLRVIIADRRATIGSAMGAEGAKVIAQALAALGVETRASVSVQQVDKSGVTLASGERILTATVVWCGGLSAHPLTAAFPVECDALGRLPVDPFLKIKGSASEFAAGDAAWFPIDGLHSTVMSCQHARPMGRFAGHNVVCDLIGEAMLPLHIDWYVTVLDLAQWGALYTGGWDHSLVSIGAEAKRTKQVINCQRIYPPRSMDPRDIFDAAAPIVQRPPDYGSHAQRSGPK